MASNAPINIDVIESSKENIQSLPSGRSARALAQVYSGSTPSTSTRSTGPLKQVLTPSHSEAENDGRRAEFERELAEEIDDSDDPLDIYDRYVKWTLDAYPSAQGTAASGLLPLLERATQPFVSSPQYANDPRYLKLWMLYIKFFSDNVMETFRFLVQHEIGSSLALFYEEYAGWLEAEGRWVQAEEIYSLGLDRGARPVERLRRKYGEFRSRFDHRPADGPTSPAIPTGRAALTSKTDGSEHDPQAADRARGSVAAAKPKKSKMMIFSDADAAAESPAGQSSSAGIPKWDSLGSMQSRRKENTQEATAWAGATLKGGKRAAGPKLEIFRDEILASKRRQIELQCERSGTSRSKQRPRRQEDARNAVSGKRERVFVNLNTLVAGEDEFTFEEVWAQCGGWMSVNWSQVRAAKREEKVREQRATRDREDEKFRVRPDPTREEARHSHIPQTRPEPAPVPSRRDLEPPHPAPPGGPDGKHRPGGKSFEMFRDPSDNHSPARPLSRSVCQPKTPAGRPGHALAPKPLQPFRDDHDGENAVPGRRRAENDENVTDENAPVKVFRDENGAENADADADGAAATRARARAARRAIRRDEKANRTTNIKVMEVDMTTTVPTNLGSPTGPRIRRRKGPGNVVQEPTMTLHTKEAMNEIYDIFNAPLRGEKGAAPGTDDQANTYDDDDDDDDDEEEDGDGGSGDGSEGSGLTDGTDGDSGSEDDGDYTSGAESGYTAKTGGQSESDGERGDGHPGPSGRRRWSDTGEDASVVMRHVDGDGREDDDDAMEDIDETETGYGGYAGQGDDDDVGDDDDRMEDVHATPDRWGGAGMQSANPYRMAGYGQRLPFMTPIVEQTESSIRLATTGRTMRMTDRRTTDRRADAKTPCRTSGGGFGLADIPDLPELDDLPALGRLDEDDENDDGGTGGLGMGGVGGAGQEGSPRPRAGKAVSRLAVFRDSGAETRSARGSGSAAGLGLGLSPDQSRSGGGDEARDGDSGPLGMVDLDLDGLRTALPSEIPAGAEPTPPEPEFQRSRTDIAAPAPPTPAAPPPVVAPARPAPARPAPIITEKMCNPTDGTVRTTILRAASPPVSDWPGFYDKSDRVRNGLAEFGRGGADRPVRLGGSGSGSGSGERDYTIKRELGRGTFAPVFLIESRDVEPPRRPLEALKIEGPASVWEFYIIRAARDRLRAVAGLAEHSDPAGLSSGPATLSFSSILSISSPPAASPPSSSTHTLTIEPARLLASRAVDSIVPAHELHLFADESYLIEDFRPDGTLLDLVNVVRTGSGPGGLADGPGSGSTAVGDELVALFFASEVVRAVEGLHSVGILHGDLKVDNVLVRLGGLLPTGSGGGSPAIPPPATKSQSRSVSSSSSSSPATWPTSPHYAATGTDGWSAIGIQLIDFGRGIDLAAFGPDTQFIADWNTTETDCVEVREMRPWRWQIDYYGLAGVVHTVLFGKYLDLVTVTGSGGGGGGGSGSGGSAGFGPGRRDRNMSAFAGACLPTGGLADKVYRPRDSPKRYWQTDIWNDLFYILLNPGRYVQQQQQQQQLQQQQATDGQDKTPSGLASAVGGAVLAAGLRGVRERMERHLEQNCRRGDGGLEGMLRKLEARMRSAGFGAGPTRR